MSMRSKLFVIGVLLSLTSVVTLAQSPQPPTASTDSKTSEDTWISIRMVPSVKLETLAKLAQGTVPEHRRINKGQDLTKLLRAKYGSLNRKIIDLFQLSNPNLKSLAVDRDMTVTLPAGPKWNLKRVTLPLQAGEDWRQQAAREIGTENPEIMAEVKVNALEASPRSRSIWQKLLLAPVAAVMVLGDGISDVVANKESSANTSSQAGTISLPYTTEFAVYRLSANTAAERTFLLEELRKDPAVVSLETIPATKLFPHWVAAKANTEAGVSS